jgi:hypothetical protein
VVDNWHRPGYVTGPAPIVVVEKDGQLKIQWPGPKPTSFEITTELFESMVDEMNAGRRLSALREA